MDAFKLIGIGIAVAVVLLLALPVVALLYS